MIHEFVASLTLALYGTNSNMFRACIKAARMSALLISGTI
jgi:hypothetical protein